MKAREPPLVRAEDRPEAPLRVRRAVAPGVPAGLGNRQLARWARTLSRRAKSVTVYLVGPPPPVEAANRATPENRLLAEEIDALDKLGAEELLKAREVAAAGAVGPASDEQRRQLQTLEALELLTSRRHLRPLQPNWDPVTRRKPTRRRLNVRTLIEDGVRKSGSFEKALESFPHTDDIDADVEFFKDEAERFGKEFKTQAHRDAMRMLTGSLDAIKAVLSSYGLPAWSALWAANRVNAHDDVGELAARVVRDAKISVDVDDDARVNKRFKFAQWAERLKKQQQVVADALKKTNLADIKRPVGARTSADDEADKANAELAAARTKLQETWIKAERAHPIFAAYRHGGELEKVDLGPLDTDDVDKQMAAVLVQVLPKIASIIKAMDLIRDGKLNPLTLPSVVALSRMNMFIPAGSIRAGVVKDLVDDATDDGSIFLQVAAFALAIVTLLPSGGASLAIPAGMAAASIAVYSVDKEWDKYSTQKTLVNTDLDLARSLSTEEPSLTGFALSLVNLGFEMIPLVGAFNKARKLKALVHAGEEASDVAQLTVGELNALGKTRGAPDLGERALADIKTAEKRAATATEPESAAAGSRKPGAPEPEPTAVPPKKRPAPEPYDPRVVPRVPGRFKAADMGFGSEVAVNREVVEELSHLKFGMDPRGMPRDWPLAMKALSNNPGPVNDQIRELLPIVMGGLRDPHLYGEVMAEAYARAVKLDTNVSTGLVHVAAENGLPIKVIRRDAGLLDADKFFGKYASRRIHFVDKALQDDMHGSMTHILQDLVVDRALKAAGKRMSSTEFRALLGEAEGAFKAGKKAERLRTGDYIWRATYDQVQLGHLPTPESLSPILNKLLALK